MGNALEASLSRELMRSRARRLLSSLAAVFAFGALSSHFCSRVARFGAICLFAIVVNALTQWYAAFAFRSRQATSLAALKDARQQIGR